MAGPYQPHQGTDPYPRQPLPYPEPYPGASYPDASYPGTLPPPVPHATGHRGRVVAAVLLSLVVIVAIAATAVSATRDGATNTQAALLTTDSAKLAIQKYLDALSDGDLQTVSRNTLCGLYDGVKDRRTDDALARLSSDAFQKQFSRADVTSVDTMVFASPNSAQVLFTMKVLPATSSRIMEETPSVRVMALRSPFQWRRRYTRDKTTAPAAPAAAPSVGVARPPMMLPRVARIRAVTGITPRSSSLSTQI